MGIILDSSAIIAGTGADFPYRGNSVHACEADYVQMPAAIEAFPDAEMLLLDAGRSGRPLD